MKISPAWLREFADLKADNHRLAEDLTSVGAAVEGITGNGDSAIFEMEITTNRPDEMNHYGVAREAAALYDLPLKAIRPSLPSVLKPSSSKWIGIAGGPEPVSPSTAPFPIEIQEPDLCPRFSARAIKNVSIEPSPAKVAERLALLDQRPINNAVDAHPESESAHLLWIVAVIFHELEHIGIDHAATENLDPARRLAGPAWFRASLSAAAANEAADHHLSAGLGEGKERRAKLGFNVGAK